MGYNPVIAIRQTPHHAVDAGWADELGKVCQALGFATGYPEARAFVDAVHGFQRRRPGLAPDGILGKQTWRQLQPVAAKQAGDGFMGPHPAWVTSIDSSIATRTPGTQPVAAPALGKSGEDLVLQEMARAAIAARNDPFRAIPVSGAYAARYVEVSQVKSDFTGGMISQTLVVGQVWQGVSGPRIIMGLSGGGSFGGVLFLTDAGQFYDQKIKGWESDLQARMWADVTRNLAPLKTILDVQAAILLGVCSAVSPLHGAMIFAGSVTQFLLQHKDDIPKWIWAAQRGMRVREQLKAVAPVLHDKVIRIPLVQVFGELPTGMRDPVKLARFLGGVIAATGIAIFTKNAGLLSALATTLVHLLFAALRALPGAGAAAARPEDLMEKLRKAGAQVDLRDAAAIAAEIRKNPDAIKRALEDLGEIAEVLKAQGPAYRNP